MARKQTDSQRELDLPMSSEQQQIVDTDIHEKQKITDHEIREFPVSVIVEKFVNGIERDEAELYIPDYQREFVWDDKQKSRFIESILLNILFHVQKFFVILLGVKEFELF